MSTLSYTQLEFKEAEKIGVLGPTGSGKSSIIRNIIMQICMRFPVVKIWWFGHFYLDETWIEEAYRSEFVSTKKLDRIRAIQRLSAYKDVYQIIILDDLSDAGFYKKNEKFWEDWFFQTRKERIFTIVGLQRLVKGLPPSLRENVQQWVIAKACLKTRKALRELSNGDDGNKKKWFAAFTTIKKGHPLLMDISPNNEGDELSRLYFDDLKPEDMQK
jgi:hypothetical protein